MNYLLDTNIVLIYLRNSQITKDLEQDLQLFQTNNNLAISVVTVAELKSIAAQLNYGQTKLQTLGSLLNQFLIIDINIEDIINKYAEIDAYSQGKLFNQKISFSARNMGKNDLWIASTSSVYNLTLLTTDNDFNHLDKIYLPLQKIDIEKYKT